MARIVHQPKELMQLPGLGNGERDNALARGRKVDVCECGPMTRASGYCDCGADEQDAGLDVVSRIGEYFPSGCIRGAPTW